MTSRRSDDRPQLTGVRHMHPAWATNRFPFTVPSIASLNALNLDAPVVCFVGENGSGKSTLLEAIAVAAQLPSVGSAGRAEDDETLEQQQWLARALKLSWRSRRYRGFFLRAEDFFGFQLRTKTERAELLQDLARIEAEYADRSDHAKQLAMGPARAVLAIWSGDTAWTPTRVRTVKRS